LLLVWAQPSPLATVPCSFVSPPEHGERTGEHRCRALAIWKSIGVIAVTVTYGIIGAILGNRVPSLSQAVVHLPIGYGYPVRLLQSTLVFVSLGIVLMFWGLVVLQIASNPLKRLLQQRPWLVALLLGDTVGCFTARRP
jgi:hypothetical protein